MGVGELGNAIDTGALLLRFRSAESEFDADDRRRPRHLLAFVRVHMLRRAARRAHLWRRHVSQTGSAWLPPAPGALYPVLRRLDWTDS